MALLILQPRQHSIHQGEAVLMQALIATAQQQQQQQQHLWLLKSNQTRATIGVPSAVLFTTEQASWEEGGTSWRNIRWVIKEIKETLTSEGS